MKEDIANLQKANSELTNRLLELERVVKQMKRKEQKQKDENL